MTTRINIKSHLAEYCIGKWGTEFTQPVEFPVHTELYVTVYNLTKKRPVDCPLDYGNLEIILPNRKKDDDLMIRKNPEVYNYISQRGSNIIGRKIEIMFWAELHEMVDEHYHRYGVPYSESIYLFLAKYRVESISEDALIKNYQRWKENRRKRKKRAYIRSK